MPKLMRQVALFCVLVGSGAPSGACRSREKAREVHATVTCSPAATDAVIDCEVEQQDGTSGANVCWVVVAHCKNGGEASSQRLCQAVQRGATVRRSLPLGDLAKGASCGRAERADVRGLEASSL